MNGHHVIGFVFYGALLLLASCAEISDFIKKPGGKRKYSTTNPAFLPYIESFQDYARIYGGNGDFKVGDIPINFGDVGNTAFTGVCYLYGDGTKEIIIRKSWWDKVSDKRLKESLVFHELGHCRLGREDENGPLTGTNVKKTLMSHAVVSGSEYGRFKKAYLKELFTHSKESLKECVKNIKSPLCP